MDFYIVVETHDGETVYYGPFSNDQEARWFINRVKSDHPDYAYKVLTVHRVN